MATPQRARQKLRFLLRTKLAELARLYWQVAFPVLFGQIRCSRHLRMLCQLEVESEAPNLEDFPYLFTMVPEDDLHLVGDVLSLASSQRPPDPEKFAEQTAPVMAVPPLPRAILQPDHRLPGPEVPRLS